MLAQIRRIHFVGIGGSGMSGLAELIKNLGHGVSGSDVKRSEATDRLTRQGIQVHVGHDARFVGDAEMLVVSAAVPSTNAEIIEAHRRLIPVIPRSEILAELMCRKYGIAVAGAHGKTSTSSMIAILLERAGLDPTVVVGGYLSAFGSSARLGQSKYMVVEADESDRTFLKLSPTIAVITNIDHEHLETFGSFENLRQAFLDFANKVPLSGTVVVSVDDPHIRELVPQIERRVITYGLDTKNSDFTANDLLLEPFGVKCQVSSSYASFGIQLSKQLHLNVPGRHNLSNALAAIAVGFELGIEFDQAVVGLSDFRGVTRRFQLVGEVRGVMVVDDYGHHPTEIQVVLETARASFCRRIILVFQPHRYTRTRDLRSELGRSLAAADEVVLTNVYGAGEESIPGATVDSIAEVVKKASSAPVHVVRSIEDVAQTVVDISRPGDLILTMGAGSIDTVAAEILEILQSESQ